MLPTRYASILKRFAACIVDLIIVLLIVGVMEAAMRAMWFPLEMVGYLTEWVGLRDMFDAMVFHLPGFLRGVPSDLPPWVVIAVCVLYHAVFEAGPRQATPGKMLFGIFVTGQDGQRISWRAGLGRGVGRLLSALICFLGYFAALLSPRSQALHDMMASTLVLEPSPAPPPQAEGPQ
jgi:uncharacterized RDD family membrane protein YckC